jgi:drug/metabolite transporter (DMT)-like permease
MAIGSISIIAPISALAVVVPVAVGLVRGERPASLVMFGIVVAIVGSVLAGYAPGEATTNGVGMAMLAALGFGSGFVFIDIAAEDGAIWAFTTARGASTIAIVAVAVAMLGDPGPRS